MFEKRLPPVPGVHVPLGAVVPTTQVGLFGLVVNREWPIPGTDLLRMYIAHEDIPKTG